MINASSADLKIELVSQDRATWYKSSVQRVKKRLSNKQTPSAYIYTFLTGFCNMFETITEIPTEDSSLNKLPIRGNDNARTRFVLTKIPRSRKEHCIVSLARTFAWWLLHFPCATAGHYPWFTLQFPRDSSWRSCQPLPFLLFHVVRTKPQKLGSSKSENVTRETTLYNIVGSASWKGQQTILCAFYLRSYSYDNYIGPQGPSVYARSLDALIRTGCLRYFKW